MKQLLTGKCKEDFEHYLSCIDLCDDSDLIDYDYSNEDIMNGVCLSMQWGVIQDFGDSKSINITLYQLDYQDWCGYEIVEFGKPISMGGVWRRDKAREEAIKHFNKLYNEKH